MLLGQFFQITQMEPREEGIKAHLKINKSHDIFKGHFPEVPVVPGVCMMEMVKELLEHHIGQPLKLAKADNMKFLSVINPLTHDEVEVDLNFRTEGSQIGTSGSLFFGPTTFFKWKIVFSQEP